MKSTHQSIIESILSSFRITLAIKNLDKKIQNVSEINLKEIATEQLLKKIQLIIKHHNKYELG
jgi:hypothetical protein